MNLIFFVLLCFGPGLFAEDSTEEKDVVVLTIKNFKEVINSNDLVLVEFYAPWCGHCKKLTPEYAKAATILKNNDPPVILAKVDATVESELSNSFDVRGYPSLKIFRGDEDVSEYAGPRTASGIVEYMRKQVGPATLEIKTIDEAIRVEKSDEPIIAGFFVDEKSEQASTFRKIASSLRDKFKFVHSHDGIVLGHFDYRDVVVLFKPYDEKKVIYSGTISKEKVTDWIYQNYLPTVGHITQNKLEIYERKGKPVMKVLIDVDFKNNKKHMDFFLNRFRKAAKVYPALNFAIADKTEFQSDKDRFGLTGKEPNQLVIENFGTQEKFKYEGKKFSLETVKEFAQQFMDKKLRPYIKSEPIPEPSKPGEVAVVVGENFNDIVLDTKKDVLIEFYAPWCGHCKQLEPKYKELAKEFKGVDSVVIAKIDATANEVAHPSYKASGYPTIYFAPANNKNSPIKYSGQREVSEMKKWVEEKASIAISKKDKKKRKKKN